MRSQALCPFLVVGVLAASAAFAGPYRGGEPPPGAPPMPPEVPGPRVVPPPVPPKTPTVPVRKAAPKKLKTLPGATPGIELGKELIELDIPQDVKKIIGRMPAPKRVVRGKDRRGRATREIIKTRKTFDHRARMREAYREAMEKGPKAEAEVMRRFAKEYEESAADLAKDGLPQEKIVGLDTMDESAKKLRAQADRIDP